MLSISLICYTELKDCNRVLNKSHKLEYAPFTSLLS